MECRESNSMLKRIAYYGLAAGCAVGLPILAYKATSIVHELCNLAHEAMEHKYGMTYDKHLGFDISPRTYILQKAPEILREISKDE